jgi:Rrf2 family protein
MLTNTCKYAIRALIYIALYGKDKRLNIKDIAKGLDVPEPFLGKIMQILSKHKILASQRGIRGGFVFNKDPHEVTFYEIIKIIDGDDIFHQCILGVRICTMSPEYAENCPFHIKLDPIQEKLLHVFKNNSIGDFADQLSDYKDFVLV